mmetsp:Transcript_6404/g.11139  ORF Transcript_6404/g.11139 Transcript_6404/m.11139 type:complete len:502 (-) Transcript_6404:225-1730(-)
MEEAANIAAVLENHLRCPIKLTQSELSQVNQGAFRAVLAFLAQRVRNPETVRKARSSALLKTRSLPVLHFKRKEELAQALLERERHKKKLQGQRHASKTLKLRKMALDLFHSKIKKLIAQVKQFSVVKPRPDSSCKLELVTLANYSDMLLSLHSQSNELPPQALKGLIESSGLTASRLLILETLSQRTRERVCELSISRAPALSSKSAAQIVESLKNELEIAQSKEWKLFLQIEGQLAEIKQLQATFNAVKAAADKSATYTKPVKALFDLRLKVSGLNAAKFQMDSSIAQLKDQERELSQLIKVRNSQSQRFEAVKAEADFLQSKAVSLTEQNAAMRQAISKYKLRVQNFLQKHVLGMKEKLPTLAKPVFSAVLREADAFFGWQPPPGRRTALTDSLLFELYTLTSISPYTSLQSVIDKLSSSRDDLEEPSLPSRSFALPTFNLASTANDLDVSRVRSLMQEWQVQGGQFCIPWRKDSSGRNIEEWLDLWRPIALQQQFSG